MHSTARHWRAPGARGIDFFAAPGPVTSAPLSGVCTLRTAGLAGVAPQWGDTIARLVPLRDALGEVLMPCVDATYTYRGGQMLAAALVDARAPGAMPGPLPGAVPVPGAPGIVEIPDAGLDARRVGHEWLVVQNGGELTFTRGVGRASRLALLRALVLQVANGLGGR
jgi:hypothetical protein